MELSRGLAAPSRIEGDLVNRGPSGQSWVGLARDESSRVKSNRAKGGPLGLSRVELGGAG
jgi:hypothetical protein